MNMGKRLVVKPDLLDEAYIPSIVNYREREIAELENCLKPALSLNRPIHVWLFGRPGTGKTLVAKHVLQKMAAPGKFGGIYVNCWEHPSYYSVMDKLVCELRILGAEKLNATFKLERFREFVGKRPFIIILDEIDQPSRSERDSMLYHLGNAGNVGLVIISNSRDIVLNMDERITSRLNARHIEFSPYEPKDLTSILETRANSAIAKGSFENALLSQIAGLSGGDARRAFQTLASAARWAESECCDTIDAKHVQAGLAASKEAKKALLLERLTSHHRLLYDLVKEHGQINSGELWEAYLDDCRSRDKPAIALRTFSEYMNRLIELDLVRWDRALIRGKVRVFRVSP